MTTHLLELLLRLVGRHLPAVLEHLDPEDGEEEGGEVVGVDAGHHRDGVPEEGRHDVHEGERGHGPGEHRRPAVPHGHDGGDEERLVAELGDDDDGEGGDEGVVEAEVAHHSARGVALGGVALHILPEDNRGHRISQIH